MGKLGVPLPVSVPSLETFIHLDILESKRLQFSSREFGIRHHLSLGNALECVGPVAPPVQDGMNTRLVQIAQDLRIGLQRGVRVGATLIMNGLEVTLWPGANSNRGA